MTKKLGDKPRPSTGSGTPSRRAFLTSYLQTHLDLRSTVNASLLPQPKKLITSQTCPNCQTHTGKKELGERVHLCKECGHETNRDLAAVQVVMQRGYTPAGHIAVQLGEAKLDE